MKRYDWSTGQRAAVPAARAVLRELRPVATHLEVGQALGMSRGAVQKTELAAMTKICAALRPEREEATRWR